MLNIFRNFYLENIVIYICTTILVLGLFSMSNSWHSLWTLVLLLFVNNSKSTKVKGIQETKENE